MLLMIGLRGLWGSESIFSYVDFFFQIDFFFKDGKSKKRKQTLKEFQTAENQPPSKILKHVCTRWLSLGTLPAKAHHKLDSPS